MENFQRFIAKDKELQQVIDNLTSVFGPLQNNPLLSGVLIRDIEITAGIPKIVNHKLGRAYIDYQVGRKNSNANVWETSPVNKQDQLYIILNSDADTKINLYIF